MSTESPSSFRIPTAFTKEDAAMVFHPEVPSRHHEIQLRMASYVLGFVSHAKEEVRRISKEPRDLPRNIFLYLCYQDPVLLGINTIAECLEATVAREEPITPDHFLKSWAVGDTARRCLDACLNEKDADGKPKWKGWGGVVYEDTCGIDFGLQPNRENGGRWPDIKNTTVVLSSGEVFEPSRGSTPQIK
jgi:hypothetical protein